MMLATMIACSLAKNNPEWIARVFANGMEAPKKANGSIMANQRIRDSLDEIDRNLKELNAKGRRKWTPRAR